MTVLEKSNWDSAARPVEIAPISKECIIVAGCVSVVVVVVVVVVMLACAVAVVDVVDVVDF